MSSWNNNLNTERSLVDAFQTSSYITIGDKDKPHEYFVPTIPSHWYLPGVNTNTTAKNPHRSVFKGKHMNSAPGKEGWPGCQPPEVYLEKKHHWVSEGDTYKDRLGYKQSQPEKKLGFQSGDFRRRDEFTKVFRTEQYRELLRGEEKSYMKDMANQKKKGILVKELPPLKEKPAKPYLYDLLDRNDKDYPNKCARDTKNPTLISTGRDFGTMLPSSHQIGWGVANEPHTKPQFAKIPIVKSSFYSINMAGKVSHKLETMK